MLRRHSTRKHSMPGATLRPPAQRRGARTLTLRPLRILLPSLHCFPLAPLFCTSPDLGRPHPLPQCTAGRTAHASDAGNTGSAASTGSVYSAADTAAQSAAQPVS